jgi:hypothetical protein
MDKGVELGLKGFDAAQVRVDKFHGGNLFGADACDDFGNGGEGRNVGHKGSARVFVHGMQVKREGLRAASGRK